MSLARQRDNAQPVLTALSMTHRSPVQFALVVGVALVLLAVASYTVAPARTWRRQRPSLPLPDQRTSPLHEAWSPPPDRGHAFAPGNTTDLLAPSFIEELDAQLAHIAEQQRNLRPSPVLAKSRKIWQNLSPSRDDLPGKRSSWSVNYEWRYEVSTFLCIDHI
jgi:hypothetical protein